MVETVVSFFLLTILLLHDVSAFWVRPWAHAAILVTDGPEINFLVLAGGDGQLSESLSSGLGVYVFTHSCDLGYHFGDLFVTLGVWFRLGKQSGSSSSSNVGGFCQSRRSCLSNCLMKTLHLRNDGSKTDFLERGVLT